MFKFSVTKIPDDWLKLHRRQPIVHHLFYKFVFWTDDYKRELNNWCCFNIFRDRAVSNDFKHVWLAKMLMLPILVSILAMVYSTGAAMLKRNTRRQNQNEVVASVVSVRCHCCWRISGIVFEMCTAQAKLPPNRTFESACSPQSECNCCLNNSGGFFLFAYYYASAFTVIIPFCQHFQSLPG